LETEDETIMDCTLPELKEAVDKIEESLLPLKSKVRYEKAFKIFKHGVTER